MSSSVPPAPVGRLVALGAIASLAGFLLGIDLAVVNGTVIAITTAFGASPEVTGLAISIALLGCAGGALTAGQMADRFGRKPMMIATAAVFVLATWGVGAASNVWEFGLYRLLGGLAAGAGSVVTPAYLAEIAPPTIRGRLIMIQQLAIVTAIMVTFFVNYSIARVAGGTDAVWLLGYPAWRWMFWVGLIPCVAYLASAFVLPESPRFLVGRERETEARAVMRRIWGSAADFDQTIAEIRVTLRREHAPRWRDLLVPGRSGKLLPIVWLGLGLGFCQQSNGINVVLYYGEVLWRTVGFAEQHALFINVLMGGALILATLTSMVLIDRVGRRPLLIAGTMIMIVTLGIMTAVFSASHGVEGEFLLSRGQALAALAAAHVFIFAYGASWAPVTWVLLGEMFPNRIRGGGIAAGGSAIWITNFAVTATFPVFLHQFGLTASYAVYTGFTVLSLFFVLRWVRETRGVSLERMGDAVAPQSVREAVVPGAPSATSVIDRSG